MATQDWWNNHFRGYAERQAASHKFKGGKLTPGWCVQCGCAKFVHAHEDWDCRPETCGGIDYDPCATASLPLHRTEAGWPDCSTCDGGGCYDCTDPA